MSIDALAGVAAFRYLYGTRDHGIKDTDVRAETVPERLHDLLCVLRVNVHTGEQDSVDLKHGIKGTAGFSDRFLFAQK